MGNAEYDQFNSIMFMMYSWETGLRDLRNFLLSMRVIQKTTVTARCYLIGDDRGPESKVNPHTHTQMLPPVFFPHSVGIG